MPSQRYWMECKNGYPKKDIVMWNYKINGCEVISIVWMEWAEIYQASIRNKVDLGYKKLYPICLKIYDKDIDVLKLKSMLEAKELGWKISSLC